MDTILEMVPFSNCDSESRIIKIVQKMVDEGDVEKYDIFFNENTLKRTRRHKKWEKEKKEAELVDMSELEKDLERNMNQRGEWFEKFLTNIEEKYTPKRKKKSITNGSRKQQKKM
ncbi:hypothetical protein NQ318_007771 [Aromia moschata]|uniref:DNAJC9 HTH domain-containing protein n=1 Tax=Aromia moschata TaxID=1265417 RepID=A0AAV8YZS5_9CUCU|nr:hypothetical protein NQ318_007771 [Aromia moschata]